VVPRERRTKKPGFSPQQFMDSRMIRMLLAAAFSLACVSSADADAKKTHRKPIACAIVIGAGGGGSGWHIAQGPCLDEIDKARQINSRRLEPKMKAVSQLPAARRRHVGVRRAAEAARAATRPSAREAIVAHPSGCPRVAFCGCGAAVRLFGAPIRSLWLAANWLRFPRAQPGPDMAAVRPHHVMVIPAYHGNGTATVYDANSGGHRTRIHERSLAGYRVVNPRAGRIAVL
jgi:hypothetical protein